MICLLIMVDTMTKLEVMKVIYELSNGTEPVTSNDIYCKFGGNFEALKKQLAKLTKDG